MTTRTDAADPVTIDRERRDLLESLGTHRFFLRNTLRGLDDAPAAARTTDRALTLGGVIKHVTGVEARWADFIVRGPVAMRAPDGEGSTDEWAAGLLGAYAQVAARTDELVRGLPDLDAEQPLPAAPWFPPGARWSARRVLLHLVAETAQHAGHADIIRESLDGAKSMG